MDPKCKRVDNWAIKSLVGSRGIVCEKVSHHQGMCDWWDNVWDPLLEPMESMGLKKWSTAEKRGAPRLLVHRIKAMGEACPKSENPVALKFEMRFLSCTCVAGFGDKCQDAARNPCGVRSMVREGKVLSQGF